MNIDEIEMTNEEALEEMSNLPTEGLNEEGEEAPEEAESEEQEKETPEAEEKPNEEEEEQVPFHKNPRFKKLVDEKNNLKSTVDEMQAKIDKLSEEKGSQPEVEDEMPESWVEMYGDGDSAKKAWKLKQEERKADNQAILEKAIATVRQEEADKSAREKESQDYVSAQLEELETSGAKFDKNELFKVLDDFRPMTEDGMFDFKKGYEILKLQKTKDPAKINARKKLADDSSKGSDKSDKGYKTPADFAGGW